MGDHSPTPAPYLSNSTIGLRAPVIEDAAYAHLWYEGDLEVGMDEIEALLKREQNIPWGGNPVIRLIAVEQANSDIVAGVLVTRSSNRTSRIQVVCRAEDARRESILESVTTLIVPWLLEGVGLMTVVMETPEDDAAMVHAAEAAGMTVAVRRREHVRRISTRVDLLQLERLNMEWGRYAG